MRSRQKGAKSPSRTGGQQPEQRPQFGVAFGLGLEVDDVRHDVPPWWIGALSAVPPSPEHQYRRDCFVPENSRRRDFSFAERPPSGSRPFTALAGSSPVGSTPRSTETRTADT